VRTIDADALKELFSEVIGRIAQKPEMNGNLEHMIRASAMVIQMIDDAPSVQPEHKTGHWIAITSRNNTYKCSVCGRLLVNITDGKNKVAKNYPYCHCGADMRGEQEQ